MKKNIVIRLIVIVFLMLICAEKAGTYIEFKSWKDIKKDFSQNFYKTEYASIIGTNILMYQHKKLGGFPKNMDMHMKIDWSNIANPYYLKQLQQHSIYCTIDNDATTTEIQFLANLYHYNADEKYKLSVEKGINYLLSLQYPNGGFKQTSAEYNTYKAQITYNDNAMINVLTLLKNVAAKEYPYDFINDEISERAKEAYYKGIDCILKTQLDNGLWALQYDKNSLKPCGARAYELSASSAGVETVNIVLFLMSIDNPSKDVINAIEKSVNWFKSNEIHGIRQELYVNSSGQKDYKFVACTDCPPLWARFYNLKTGKPFFSDRSGKIFSNIEDIDRERRVGYDWYSSEALKIYRKYPKWKKRYSDD